MLKNSSDCEIIYRNLDPNQESTGFVPLDTMKPHIYSSKFSVHTGRALLSYDYEGSTVVVSTYRKFHFVRLFFMKNLECSVLTSPRLLDDYFLFCGYHSVTFSFH